MFSSKTEKTDSVKPARKSRAAEVANTFEWLITAFILAFVFRAFVMEAFRIPTGSMADTLMGAHFRLCCPQCGYKYNHGFIPEKYGLPQDTTPRGDVRLPWTRCPSCGYYPPIGKAMPIANGDRILVLKCIYQFFEPQRWDVIVFKNPLDPSINYIKRLIGRQDETVEIIDGDIYIDGQISRKPLKVQNELWMPVYDNDYQPVQPREPAFNKHTWQQPFKNIADSEWTLGKNIPIKFCLNSSVEKVNSLIYDTSVGNDFRATYAYDDVDKYPHMPYCSDLMVRFYAERDESLGVVGIELSKYGIRYRAWFDFKTRDMIITKSDDDTAPTELARKCVSGVDLNKPNLAEFANVDHQLIFQFGDEKLTYDLGYLPDDAGQIRPDVQPRVEIFGSGELTLSHVAVFRDIHYLEFSNGSEPCRAGQGNPLKLGKDEFFVLGDNSPNSADGRLWDRKGRGNNGRTYREGIVPRDYLVGKALFVYWPSGFRPFGKSRFALIPNVGRMRFIYGGSDKKL